MILCSTSGVVMADAFDYHTRSFWVLWAISVALLGAGMKVLKP